MCYNTAMTLKDCPVIVASTAGTYVGRLKEHEDTHAVLTNCRCLIAQRPQETWLDLSVKPSQRELQVSHQNPGPVALTGVTMIAPLTDSACKAIVRASEDNLAI